MAHAVRHKNRKFDQNFNFHLRKDHQKNFLRVGRRKKARFRCYVRKNDEKKNLVHKGLKMVQKQRY